MKLTIRQNPAVPETEITILCSEMNPRLQKLAEHIRQYGFSLTLYQEKREFQIPLEAICFFDSTDGKTFAYQEKEVYECRESLAGAVGREGYLSVIKDMGLKEPYSGQVPLISGELAEDVTNYYATSEQTPSSCALGVLVNPDLTVRAAGGFLVQLLPNAAESTISRLEENIRAIPPVSSLIDQEYTPAEICGRILEGLDPVLLDEFTTEYRCDCSRERVERAVLSLGKAQLDELIEEDHGTEVGCHFCGKLYRFSEEDLKALRDRAAR